MNVNNYLSNINKYNIGRYIRPCPAPRRNAILNWYTTDKKMGNTVEKTKQKMSSFAIKSKNGVIVVFKSLTFIWHHKKLLFFPLLTATLIIGSVGVYDAVYYQLYNKHITSFFPEENKADQDSPSSSKSRREYPPEFLLFSAIITFVSIFFFAFSNVALSYSASQAFTQAPVKIGKSLMHSIKKLPTLLLWALSAFFIHMLVNIFKGENENGRSSFLGRLIGTAIEFAWFIATFLVIPVFAHETIGTFSGIKRSAFLMKKTFGENLVGTLILQGLNAVLLLVWLFISCGIAYATVHMQNSFGIPLFLTVGAPLIGLLLIVVGILCTAISAATTVFKTAVYHYAIGNPVGPFHTRELQASFTTASKK